MYSPIEIIQAIGLMIDENVARVRYYKSMRKYVEIKFDKPLNKIELKDINPYFKDSQSGVFGNAPAILFVDDAISSDPIIVAVGESDEINKNYPIAIKSTKKEKR